MSPLTNGLTPHEVQRQERRGWNYLFIAPVEAHLLTELFHSPPGPVEECRAQHAGPWLWESMQSAASPTNLVSAGPIKRARGEKEAKFIEFGGDYLHPSILSAAYAMDWRSDGDQGGILRIHSVRLLHFKQRLHLRANDKKRNYCVPSVFKLFLKLIQVFLFS